MSVIWGRAIVAWVAKMAAKSNRYKIRPDGTFVFRIHAIGGIYGIFGTLCIVACLFISDIAVMLLILAIAVPAVVPFFLYYLFARIYINDEKIIYRNPLGRRREIAWKDLDTVVSIGDFGDIMLYGGGAALRLYPYFSGFGVVQKLLHQYRPTAFDPGYAFTHVVEFRRDGTSGYTFRWIKSFRIPGLAFILFGFAFLLLPNRMFVSEFGSQFMGKFMITLIFVVCGLPLVLLYVNVRLYIDDEMIEYRNIFGGAKQVRWEDVSSYRIEKSGFYRRCIRIFYGDKKKITISDGFVGHDLIKHLVQEIGKRHRIRFW